MPNPSAVRRPRPWPFKASLILLLTLALACRSERVQKSLDLSTLFARAIQGPIIAPKGPLWELESNPFIGPGFALGRSRRPRLLFADRGELRFYALHRVPVQIQVKAHPGDQTAKTVRLTLNGQALGPAQLSQPAKGVRFPVSADQVEEGENRVLIEGAAGTRWEEFRVNSHDGTPEITEGHIRLPFGATLDFPLVLERGARLKVDDCRVWYRPGAPLGELPWRLRVRLQGAAQDQWLELNENGSLELGVQKDGPHVLTLHATAPEPLPGQLGLAFSASLAKGTAGAPGPTHPGAADGGAEPGTISSPRGPSEPKNVLVYLVDTLRPDYLGCYGQELPLTPNIDALAKDSVLFERALAQAPWTQPSVASIFTSLDPRAHGVQDFGDVLDGRYLTLAEVLSAQGYQCFGWVTNPLVQDAYGYGQGFQSYQLFPLESSRRLTQEARDWLDRRDREKPFFLYLHSLDPHETYDPPEPFRTRFAAGSKPTVKMEVGAFGRETQRRRQKMITPEVNPETHERATSLYAAEVAANDHQFGLLLQALKARGLYQDTLIVFLSDHGEEFGDHGYFGHMNSLHQELVRVPMLIKFPGSPQAGRRVTDPIQHLDLAPTILKELGFEIPAAFQGECWQDGPDPTRPIAINLDLGHRPWQDRGPLPRQAWSLRRGSRLVIRSRSTRTNRSRPLEYYDLDQDPEERDNLFFSRKLEALFLLSELQALEANFEELPATQSSDRESVEEVLRSLNYL